MKTRPYRRGLLIYPPYCALLFITADERLQGLWANNPSDAQPAVFSFCCRRRIGDSWALLSQRRTLLKAPQLMSRFITASPSLPMLVTWWFITVSQPPSTSIMSRFIHLVDAFCRSVLLPFLSLGASGFRLARAVSFCSVLGHPGVLNLIYVCLYEDIYIYILLQYAYSHTSIYEVLARQNE